mmetsp:Transcript_122640/g.392600  ORF Transcript_122640/g.392600 Transcript_122640/m.392600 type:complete len:446 (+) Transcript_122640:820-2157(+)
MAEMEAEVMAEFDLRKEADAQERGQHLLEGLLGGSSGDCAWLEEWRDGALSSVLRPAGPAVTGHALNAWHAAGASAAGGAAGRGSGARPGLVTRLTRQAFGGRAVVETLAAGEEHVNRLRVALRRLQVEVPSVMREASGEQVLAMSLAHGRSLTEVLDVVAHGPKEHAEKAAAWFAALLMFVVVPLWGKMLLVVGCCHADPHPGNFKVDCVPGLEEAMSPASDSSALPPPPAPRRGLLSRVTRGGGGSAPPIKELGAECPIRLSILDWGSCVDLGDDIRQTLCKLLVSLSALRIAQGQLQDDPDDVVALVAAAEATTGAAASVRQLGIQPSEGCGDAFLAALGMALFDPSVAANHPELRGGKAEQLGRSFPASSGLGKVLRVVAILVGICRELETKLNDEATDRAQAMGGIPGAASRASNGSDRPFVELFLVELWRPFAEEGLQI